MTDPLVFRGPEGSITVTAAALTRHVGRAAQTVEGAQVRRPKRAVAVSELDGRLAVELRLAVAYGAPIPPLALDVQARVAQALSALTGRDVERVDIEIAEVG